MKNLFKITDLAMDKSEEMITFTLQINELELIPGRIKYELKKGTDIDLSSFSGLNDSHGYTEFTTLDLVLDGKNMEFYNEDLDKFTGKILLYDSITQVIIDKFMIQKSPSLKKSCVSVCESIFEAVNLEVENNATTLLEGES